MSSPGILACISEVILEQKPIVDELEVPRKALRDSKGLEDADVKSLTVVGTQVLHVLSSI